MKVKQSKINRLIMGLSCLGVLSAVSCDNESKEPKIAPPLGEVSFLASDTNDAGAESAPAADTPAEKTTTSVTFAVGDKIKVYIKDNENKGATYYTAADRSTGTKFVDGGTEFEFIADPDGTSKVVIKGGLFLEGAADTGKSYTLTQFDIIKKSNPTEEQKEKASYVIKEDKTFAIKTDTNNLVEVSVVKNEGITVIGEPSPSPKGIATSFTVMDNSNPYQFKLTLKKSDGTLFNSTTDKDDVIALTIKDGEKAVDQPIVNLFADGLADGSEIFTITLPREIAHYSNGGAHLTIAGTVTPKDGTAHDFTIESGTVKEGPVVLKVTNKAPVITFNGADGSDNTKTEFNVITQTSFVTVFTVTDDDDSADHKFKAEYKWTLKNTATQQKRDLEQDNLQTGKVNPNEIKNVANDTWLNEDTLVDLSMFTLEVRVTADDGLGGKDELTKTFTFTK